MADSRETLNEELISAFIVSTCRLLPKLSVAVTERMKFSFDTKCHLKNVYEVYCGSNAEFYIQPLHSCIGDTDNIFCRSDELAFIDDFPVFPNDPRGLDDTVECYKIEPCLTHPGFVRLQGAGKMSYNWKLKKYEFYHATSSNRYTAVNVNIMVCPTKTISVAMNGPALAIHEGSAYVKLDMVASVWCPKWPREAQNWPIRPRNYGWPTTATISEVVQNGCHVVYVQHRACRDDRLQWRFSFSVAEVILLQSWTQVQQIVYHMLRFLAKREIIKKDCLKEDEVLCTYHLKTLMLWTCEEKSTEWWNLPSVIAVCCKLLQKLSEWLKMRHCPNYFIPEANLFHEHMNPIMITMAEKRLNEFCNSDILCHWFETNYLLPSILKFVELRNSTNEMPHPMDCMLYITECLRLNEAASSDILFSAIFHQANIDVRYLWKCSGNAGLSMLINNNLSRLRVNWKDDRLMTTVPTTENVLCLKYYNATLHILHTTYGLGCGKFLWDSLLFVDFVIGISLQTKIVRSQYHKFPNPSSTEQSQLHFVHAQNLMENLTGSNSRSEFQLLFLVSKQHLISALQGNDSRSNSIAAAALVYLAALNFVTSEYRTTMDLCSTVSSGQSPQKEDETLNAGCLFFIDDVVRIVGFCLLYRKIKNNEQFTSTQYYLDLRVKPEVFAHYLTALCVEIKSNHSGFNHDLPHLAFPVEQYLMLLTKRKFSKSMKESIASTAPKRCAYRITYPMRAIEALYVNPLESKEKIICILMEYALEKMTSFYGTIRTNFGIQCNIVDCYRALYLYKRRQYMEVLNLCEEILHEPDLQSDLQELAFANVLVLPPLDSYFDEDVQSLLGFHTLFCYLSPANDKLLELKKTRNSTFEQIFAQRVYDDKDVLSTCLTYPYSPKCHYFLGRHFLARYLKLRCFIVCNNPHKETIVEFDGMKRNFPFEHIIHRFLLQKLSNIKKYFNSFITSIS